MESLETVSFIAALISLGIAAVLGLWQFRPRRRSPANISSTAQKVIVSMVLTIAVSGVGFLTLSIIARAVITGHGPFSNMYEFSMAFSWGIVVMGLFFQWRYQIPILSTLAVIVALALLIYAYILPSRPIPLVPALQQSFLLSTHVAAAVIAYGTFTIGFGTAVLYLFQRHRTVSWIPELKILDEISYHTVVIGFPFMALVIILGALWADVAWGRYWGWDPKETTSLVTLLLYASYLHARVTRGWRGTKTAILLIVGFCAILLTFFGNYIFTGLHSYR